MAVLRTCYQDDLIVAVDASVGNREHVGYVTLGKGGAETGTWREQGAAFGGGYIHHRNCGKLRQLRSLMLQSVRLSVVMQMADCISRSISLVEKFWDNTAFV